MTTTVEHPRHDPTHDPVLYRAQFRGFRSEIPEVLIPLQRELDPTTGGSPESDELRDVVASYVQERLQGQFVVRVFLLPTLNEGVALDADEQEICRFDLLCPHTRDEG